MVWKEYNWTKQNQAAREGETARNIILLWTEIMKLKIITIWKQKILMFEDEN